MLRMGVGVVCVPEAQKDFSPAALTPAPFTAPTPLASSALTQKVKLCHNVTLNQQDSHLNHQSDIQHM